MYLCYYLPERFDFSRGGYPNIGGVDDTGLTANSSQVHSATWLYRKFAQLTTRESDHQGIFHFTGAAFIPYDGNFKANSTHWLHRIYTTT